MPRTTPDLQVTANRSALSGWLADRGVNTKVLLAVFVASAAAALITAVAMIQAGRADGELTAMKTTHVDSLQELSNIRGGIGAMFRGVFLISNADKTLHAPGQENLDQADVTVAEAVAAYRVAAAGSPARLAALTQFEEGWRQHSGLRKVIFEGSAPPAGIVVPPADKITEAFVTNETSMLDAIGKLQAAEDSEAAAEAARGRAD